MQGRDANDILKELFESFLHDYQEKIKTIKGSDFVFESVYLMNYFPKWLENKKATINPKNENDDECF